MTISGFDALFYTIGFLVPGFVWNAAVSALLPQKGEQPQISFVRFLTFSCMNYALWSWLVYLLVKSEFFTKHPVRSACAWGLIILVSPMLLGLLTGHLSQNETALHIMRRLGLRPIHPIPSAWDYKFSLTTSPAWILVTMKDGSKVGGVFGSRSFASSDTAERDLYVQEVYRVTENGQWQKAERNDGILLRAEQIRHVEFWRDEEGQDD